MDEDGTDHTGVGDKSIVAAANLGDRLEKSGSEIIAEAEGINGSLEKFHVPNLWDVALR
jgi:hypothetical protein